MNSVKYIGMDVHKEAICIAVLNSSGKPVMECVIETKAITMLDFLKGLRGSLHVTFEEATWAAWLYDLIKPHVTELAAYGGGPSSRCATRTDHSPSGFLFVSPSRTTPSGEVGKKAGCTLENGTHIRARVKS